MTADDLVQLANDESLLEVGRLAIESEAVSFRDSRISYFTRGNGIVCREKDGTASSVIRFGPEVAVKIALLAIAEKLRKEELPK